jgi:hypothetical protein
MCPDEKGKRWRRSLVKRSSSTGRPEEMAKLLHERNIPDNRVWERDEPVGVRMAETRIN